MEAHHHITFPSSMPSASNPHDERPSFTNYWRKLSREDSTTAPSVRTRTITFVQSDPSQRASSKQASSTSPKSFSPNASSPPSHQTDSPPSSSDSAERTIKRRAQVRRAQIQHRQRKANYVKQLEADIADMREQIAGAERERSGLRAENQSIRAHFVHQSTPASMSSSPPAGATVDDFSHYCEQQQFQHQHDQVDPAACPLGSPSSLSMEQDMFSSLYPAATAAAHHHHISLQRQEDVFIQRDNYLGGSGNGGGGSFQMGLDLDLETPHSIDNEISFFNAPVSEGGLYDVLATPMTATAATNYYEQSSSSSPLSLPTAAVYYGSGSASHSPLPQQHFTNSRRTGTSAPASYLYPLEFEGAAQW